MQFIHLYLSINVKNPEAESLFHYYLQIQSPVAAGSNQQLHTPTNPCLLQSTANTSNNLFVPNSHIAPTSCILKPLEDKNSHLICTHLDKVIFSDAEKFVICSAPPSNNPMQGQGGSNHMSQTPCDTIFVTQSHLSLCSEASRAQLLH